MPITSKLLISRMADEKIDRYGNIQYSVRVDVESRSCNDCEFYWVVFNKDGRFYF